MLDHHTTYLRKITPSVLWTTRTSRTIKNSVRQAVRSLLEFEKIQSALCGIRTPCENHADRRRSLFETHVLEPDAENCSVDRSWDSMSARMHRCVYTYDISQKTKAAISMFCEQLAVFEHGVPRVRYNSTMLIGSSCGMV